MKLPQLEAISTSRIPTDAFLGYNHNDRIGDGEFYDMSNLVSDAFPTLMPREKRGAFEYPEILVNNAEKTEYNTQGIIVKDNLCFVEDGTLYINSVPVQNFPLTPGEKQLVSMGAYIVIFPDNKYFNTAKHEDRGDLGADFIKPEDPVGNETKVRYSLCNIDGTDYENVLPDSKPPKDTTVLWMDTSSSVHVLKQYSTTSSMWVQIPTVYIKISYQNIGNDFEDLDGVLIKGLPKDNPQLQELEGKTSIIQKREPPHKNGDEEPHSDYIVVIGVLDGTVTSPSRIEIHREIPTMDFVVESNNRLWGCYYGVKDNEMLNEIYACRLGDFKNWRAYMGASTDSYAVSVGTDGQWTGAVSYLGYPLFFKENVMHKIYGQFPSNYQVQTTECRGVQKGSAKSLVVVNETLYYKSRVGVCAYDGSLPSVISNQFGEIHYTATDQTEEMPVWDILRCGAVGGTVNNKYYISMKSEADNEWYLFIYDTVNGLWHKQDKTHALQFVAMDNELYYIDATDKKIKTMFGSGTRDESPVQWYAETGLIGLDLPDNKYISRILIRMAMEIGSIVKFSIQYDSTGAWKHIGTVTGRSLRSFNLPIRPKRCDHFKLRIEGIGKVKIFSMIKNIEQGSDV